MLASYGHSSAVRMAGLRPSASVSRAMNLQEQLHFFSTSEEKKEDDESAKDTSTTTEDNAEPTEETPSEEQETVSKEDELQAEVKSLKDQLLRSLAEQENIRQIARRDVEAARNFSIKSFAKSLLEVSDNLSRALESVDKDTFKENPSLETLYQGVDMTNGGLTKALESNGVKKFCEQPGDIFNPERHEALMEYPDPSKESGTVGQVIKVGFTLNDRVLRPAEVGVVKNP